MHCHGARALPYRSYDTSNQLAKETRQLSCSFSFRSSRENRIASLCQAPMDNLDSRIALVRRLQAATRKLTSRSNFCPALLQTSASPLVRSWCHCWLCQWALWYSVQLQRKRIFFARVEWLPVTFRSEPRTDGRQMRQKWLDFASNRRHAPGLPRLVLTTPIDHTYSWPYAFCSCAQPTIDFNALGVCL